jgi:regulator of protease activity HflC (stomatin/prohibitin superfamily)
MDILGILSPFFCAVVIILITLLLMSVRIVNEYERGVVFRLGRFLAVKGPGPVLIIPLIDKMVKVDLRTVTLDVPAQEAISRDNVTVKVNAVVYFRVFKPDDAVIQVEDAGQPHKLPKPACVM